MTNDNKDMTQDLELPVAGQTSSEEFNRDFDLLAEVLAHFAGTN